VQLTYSKFAVQGIRKVAAMGWKPLHVVNSNCSSIGGTLAPAGLENAKGLVSAWWEVIPTDPRQQDRPRVKAYAEFMKKYMPSVSLDDNTATPGYNNAYMIEQVLRRCGNELTRENLLKHATSLKDEQPPLFWTGSRLETPQPTTVQSTIFRSRGLMVRTGFRSATWSTSTGSLSKVLLVIRRDKIN
jgi:branched-chain amino acid transport system substrate-binding protein